MNQDDTKINFEPLTNYKPFNEIRGVNLVSLIMAFTAITLILVPVAVSLVYFSDYRAGVVIPAFLCFVILVCVLSYYFHRKKLQWQHNQENMLRAFAQINAMTYLPGDNVPELGTLFGVGDTKKARNVLSGSINGLPFRSFEYYYMTGTGKNRASHDAMVMEFTLPRVLPQFVIDSQLEDIVPLRFDKSQKIELEGDFHKYFDVYAPDTYGVSALVVLAPNAMEVLMERAASCDIEIIQNKLYFYWQSPANSQRAYQNIYETAQAILGKIGKKLIYDDIYANKTQAQVHAMPVSQGARLKPSNVAWYVVVLVIALFAIQLFDANALIMPLIIFGFLIAGAISGRKKEKLKREYSSRYGQK